MPTVITILVAAAGVVVSVLAYLAAKQANQEAESANGIAREALAKAVEANQIAERANQLSKDANTFAGRSVAQQEEGWLVDWAVTWNKDRVGLGLVNTGSDKAFQVAVVIQGDDLHQIWGGETALGPGEDVLIPVAQFGEENLRHLRAVWQQGHMGADGLPPEHLRFTKPLTITIRWRTGLGFPESTKLEVVAG